MAALAGERVCALDCDVRQPAFGRLLGADGELGLTDLLAGHATEEQVMRQDTLSGMRYIAGGLAGGQRVQPVHVGGDGAGCWGGCASSSTSCCSTRRRPRR